MKISEIVVELGGSERAGKALEETAEYFGVKLVDHWLAQIYVESAGFKRARENLNYRPERLLAIFPGRNGLKTLDQAKEIVSHGPAGIGEAVYGLPWGAKNLGNTQLGDGGRFIGRGFKQLTGRANYTAYSRDTYGDDRCAREPERLERLPDAARSAGWFWKSKKIDTLGDNIEAITKRVNGGLNGLDARRAALARIRKLM